MALERDDGERPAEQGGDDAGEQGGVRAKMTPERREQYDSLLADLEAGADQDPARAKKVPTRKGAAAVRPAAAAPARYGDDRDAPDADDEDMELLPEEDGLVEGTEDPAKPKPAKKPPPRQPTTPDEDDEDEDEDDLDDDDQDDDDEDADDETDDEPEDEDDEETADDEAARAAKAKLTRGLRQLAAKEARNKAADARRRSEFEAQRAEFIAEWQPRVAKVKEYEALLSRAERDPAGVVLEFATKVAKLEGTAWQHVSKQMYLRSPAARENPASAAEAAAAQRELESTGALRQMQEQIAGLTRQLEERDRAEENVRAARGYLKRAVAMADDETPLLRRMARKDPAGLKDELHQLAAKLAEEAGRAVHPRKLIRSWEKRERARLERLGVKTKKAAATPDAEKTSKRGAAKPKTAPNGANGQGAPLDRKALQADVLRNLESQPTGRAARA